MVTRVMIIDCDGLSRGGQSDGHANGWPGPPDGRRHQNPASDDSHGY